MALDAVSRSLWPYASATFRDENASRADQLVLHGFTLRQLTLRLPPLLSICAQCYEQQSWNECLRCTNTDSSRLALDS